MRTLGPHQARRPLGAWIVGVGVALVFGATRAHADLPPSAPLPPASAPGAPAPAGPPLIDNAVLLDAWVASGLTATGSAEARITVGATRKDLDTSLVVTIVQERLREVALRAAGDLLRKLTGDADRLWARDLLMLAARLTATEPELRRATAEAVVRLAIRAVIAEAVVRTRFPTGEERQARSWAALRWTPAGPVADADAELRAHLGDWVYWRLSKHPLVADRVARPSCNRRVGNAGALCAVLAALDEPRAIVCLDAITELTRMLDGITLVARVQTSLRDQPMAPRAIIRAFLASGGLVTFKGGGALDPATWRRVVGELRLVAGTLAGLQYHTDRLRKRAQGASVKIELLVAGADGTTSAMVAAELATLQAILATKVGALTVRELLVKAGGETMDAWLLQADAAFTRVRTRLGISATLTEDDLAELRRAFSTLVALQPPDLAPVLLQLDNEVNELAGFLATRLDGDLELDKLRTSDGAQLGRMLDRVAGTLDKARIQLGGYDPVMRTQLADVLVALRRASALVDKVTSFAALIAGDRLCDVTNALRALGVREATAVATPLLDVLEPVLEPLAEGRPITMPMLYRALAELGPSRVARALGLPDDLERLCADDQPPWKCWAGRLALGVHDAVRVDGTAVEIDTTRVLERLVTAGLADRKQRRGAVFLHAAVGAGGVWLDGGVPPLIAEQLGVGMNVAVGEHVALRVAVFGSGLLYRFVLDSQVSDGVIVGAAVLIDLYDTVELYAAPIAAFHPADEGRDGVLEGGVAFGVQVPLGEYLARLRE